MLSRTRKLWLAAAMLAVAAGAGGCWYLDVAQRAGRAQDVLALSGNIEAHESVLSFKSVQSRIVELPFNEGQWVAKGSALAVLDDADYRQQVAIADANRSLQQAQSETAVQNLRAAERSLIADQATLEQRRADYDRLQQLEGKGFVSVSAVEQAATAMQVAQAVLERDRALRAVAARSIQSAQAGVQSSEEAARLARIVQGYTVLQAPFDGVVTVRQAELGEVVVPGTPVLTIADLDHVWLRAYVNEQDIGRVKLGQPVRVKTDGKAGAQYRGRVGFIASKAEFTPKSVETHAERVTLVYRVKIELDNPRHTLLPGMPADAYIELAGAERP